MRPTGEHDAPTPLRVLLVEDDDDDEQLILRELTRAGFAVDASRVQDEAGLRAAIAHGPWDVVLSDHVVPGFGSQAALEILGHAGSDVPFILVSGRIGEDAVATVLREGAIDYVSKDDLSRLGPAIQRGTSLAGSRRRERELQRALGRSEERFRGLLEAAPDAIVITDASSAIVLVNTQTERLLGYGRDELLGQPVELLLAERYRAGHGDKLRNFFARPTARPMGADVELYARRKDGGELPVEISLSPLETDDGPLVSAAIRDVTERKTIERRERESKVRLQALLDYAPFAISLRDLDGRFELVNRRAAELMGDTPENLVNRPPAELYESESAATIAAQERIVRDGGGAITFEITGRLSDGTDRDSLVTKYPVADADGRVIGVGGISLDITDRKRVEQELREAEERFRHAFENAPIGIALVSPDGSFVRVNRVLCELVGYPETELLSLTFHDITHPDDLDADLEYVRQVLADEIRTYEMEKRYLRADGSIVWVLLSVSLVRDPDGRPSYFIAQIQDIDERKRAEETRQRLAAIIEQTGDAVVARTPDGIITEWNHGAERLYGYTSGEAIGSTLDDLTLVDRTVEERAILQRVIDTGRVEHYETVRVRKDGELLDVSITISPIRDASGTIVAASTIARDVSERKHYEGQLQHLADHDTLTGLFNRRRFEEELERELMRATRHQTMGALLIVDIDHFKYINDSLGHAAGDELIARTGTIFRERLRQTDVLARLGGDEFAIVLIDVDETEARLVASNLLQALRSQSNAETRIGSRRITASIGVAVFAHGETFTADELLVRADIAMYDAKEAGRDRASTYDKSEDRQTVMHARLTWADRIRAAIDEQRFLLHAQPIVSLTDDPKPRHELLIRMLGEDGDLIPPASFLYVAERFDLIQQIDRWVLHQAIGLLADEQHAGHDIRLNVNISAKSLVDPDLATRVAHELDTAGADGHGLCLEITETAAIVNVDRANRFASQISRLGCELALDDFGAGFASFYYLKHLRFDYLKIDGEFIARLAESHTDQLVVRSIVDIARGLEKRTVAEFVGDAATLELLRDYKVDYAQGYHISRPGPFAPGDLARTATLAQSTD
jgi:diguanylate cyclase (GGDEF)-like protein/PAS domain S-box-containing protein